VAKRDGRTDPIHHLESAQLSFAAPVLGVVEIVKVLTFIEEPGFDLHHRAETRADGNTLGPILGTG
jgi:hypothetical protein